MSVVNFVLKPRTAFQYDGSNAADLLAAWTGQTAGDLVCEGSIVSEGGGSATLQFDSWIDEVWTTGEWIFTVNEGDWVVNITDWRTAQLAWEGLGTMTNEQFTGRYQMVAP